MKKLSSSKRSDGHTLALTEEGSVYSWGDGDYGKLGHGNCLTQKQPKLIGGVLQGKVVKCIHAGKNVNKKEKPFKFKLALITVKMLLFTTRKLYIFSHIL